jgi:hypothetical protein
MRGIISTVTCTIILNGKWKIVGGFGVYCVMRRALQLTSDFIIYYCEHAS